VSCSIFAVWNDDTVLCRDRGVQNLCPDYKVRGPLKVDLRAELNANGQPRSYTIKLVCKDATGNTTSATTTVSVSRRALQPAPRGVSAGSPAGASM
jgi:hypothetical protein